MKFEWETIYDKDFNITYRAKVLGGWLINNVFRVNGNPRPTMVFVEDKNHHWSTEENYLLEIAIDDFNINQKWLSPRTINCLKAENIKTVKDLLSWCEHQLYLTPNLGRKSLREINDLLELVNLKINTYPHTNQGEYKSKCRECLLGEL